MLKIIRSNECIFVKNYIHYGRTSLLQFQYLHNFQRGKMEDFEKTLIEDITVETVNLTRATFEHAGTFKSIIMDDISNGIRKMVIDLSNCDFMDSTFIGVLVVTLKEIRKLNGKLRIVKPYSIAHSILETTNTLRVFDIYDSIDEAANSF